MMKKIAIMLVLILTVTVCVFSLAGCDEEENDPEQKEFTKFELYHGDRYLKEYTYSYIQLYVYDEEYETYRGVTTWWDEGSNHASTDDLRGYDYLLNYRNGKYDNEEWNAIFLKGKEYIKAIGETVTINMNDITVDGTLGTVPSYFRDTMSTGHVEFRFDLPDEEESKLFISNVSIEVYYHAPSEKSKGSFVLDFWSKSTEIAGKKYQMNFFYQAALEPGDSDWSDSLAGKVEE